MNPATFRVIRNELARRGINIICPDCGGDTVGCRTCITVNSITQAPARMADTLSNREAIPQPETEQANMFTTSKTDYVVFLALAFALVGAVIG